MKFVDEKLINFDEIIYLLKKKIWILILITGVMSCLGAYKTSLMTTSYQATAKIYVGRGNNLMDYYSQNEIQYYNEFMNTFNEIIRVDDFLNETLKKYKINKSSWEVKNSLGFSASENTPIFTITYNASDMEGAEQVLTAICEEFNEQAKTIIPDANPRIIDSTKVYPIIPNKKKLMLMYFGVGIIFSLGIIFFIDYLDDTIKSNSRLEKVLPVPVLGNIPKHENGFKGGRE